MPGRRYSDRLIARAVQATEAGLSFAEVYRKLGITDQALCRWNGTTGPPPWYPFGIPHDLVFLCVSARGRARTSHGGRKTPQPCGWCTRLLGRPVRKGTRGRAPLRGTNPCPSARPA
ncbi:MAG: transposase [Planctomycetota bacterium]